MKPFNLIYYLFIFGSMLVSIIMAPAMFIEHRALVGWLWVLVFHLMLFFLLSEAIDKTTAKGLSETQKEQIIRTTPNFINMDFAISNKLFELETEKRLLESELVATNATISQIHECQRSLRRQHG